MARKRQSPESMAKVRPRFPMSKLPSIIMIILGPTVLLKDGAPNRETRAALLPMVIDSGGTSARPNDSVSFASAPGFAAADFPLAYH